MKLKGNQKGFTLIEVLVTVGILGAIMGVMSMTVMSIMIIAPRSSNWAIALRQVQNAGYWISRDVLMSENVTVDEPGVFLALEWDDGGGAHYEVDYVFSDGELRRQLNGASPGTLVAQYIVEADTSFVVDDLVDTKYDLTVKASHDGVEVERVYGITPRLGLNPE
jgi:prepilin-type N-terminal cleavage/methylation domain-containing protein